MNNSWIFRRSLILLGLVVVVGFALVVAGCSKKPEIETVVNEVIDEGDVTEDVPVPPKPEEVAPEVELPDYAAMDPSEYGVVDVFFGFDEYDLDNRAMAQLSTNARMLKEADVTVLISGHCDERGTIEYNLALGEKRAIVVRDYLISLGVPARNLKVTSYGESKPFDRGHAENAWSMNRRAHFERP